MSTHRTAKIIETAPRLRKSICPGGGPHGWWEAGGEREEGDRRRAAAQGGHLMCSRELRVVARWGEWQWVGRWMVERVDTWVSGGCLDEWVW